MVPNLKSKKGRKVKKQNKTKKEDPPSPSTQFSSFEANHCCRFLGRLCRVILCTCARAHGACVYPLLGALFAFILWERWFHVSVEVC